MRGLGSPTGLATCIVSRPYLGIPYNAGSVPLLDMGFERGKQGNKGFGPGDCGCIPTTWGQPAVPIDVAVYLRFLVLLDHAVTPELSGILHLADKRRRRRFLYMMSFAESMDGAATHDLYPAPGGDTFGEDIEADCPLAAFFGATKPVLGLYDGLDGVSLGLEEGSECGGSGGLCVGGCQLEKGVLGVA